MNLQGENVATPRRKAKPKLNIDAVYARAIELIESLGHYTQNYPFEWCKHADDCGARNSGNVMAIYTAIMEHKPSRAQLLQLLDECWRRFNRRGDSEPRLDVPTPAGFVSIPIWEHTAHDPPLGVSRSRYEHRDASWLEVMAMFIAGQLEHFATDRRLMRGYSGRSASPQPYIDPLAPATQEGL